MKKNKTSAPTTCTSTRESNPQDGTSLNFFFLLDKTAPSTTQKARFAMASALLALSLPTTVQAQESVTATQAKPGLHRFDIGKQPLYSALAALAEQGGIQFVYTAEMVKGLTSPGVIGQFTIEEALKRILEGSGLGYRFSRSNTITLERKAVPASSGSSSGDTIALDKMTVSATAEYDQNDPYNEDYAVPNAITATKTDTPIMETPVSIQVLPRAVMDDQKSTRVKDALENVSGVRPTPTLGTGTGFTIRGFRNPRIYRNGLVANAANAGFPTDYEAANLASIEVLKGPAAVLFGRIEPGGLINLTTKRPLDAPYYSVEQQFGSYDYYRTQWDAGGSVTEDGTLLYRFSGAYQNSNSFRDFLFTDRIVVSPSITWRPTDSTDFTLNIEGLNQDYQADFGIPVIGDRPANIPISRVFGDPNDPEDNLAKVHLGTEFNHRFNDDWAIHNRFLASYTHNNQTFLNPAPAFNANLSFNPNTGILRRNVFYQENDAETYATNLDVTGRFRIGPSKHEILVGFDYLRSFTEYRTRGYFSTPNPALDINIYNPGPSYGIDSSVFKSAVRTREVANRGDSVFKDEWYGVYFQDHITLWDTLHILGGGRYDWAETGRGTGGSMAAANKALPSAIRKDEGFSPRVGILYQPWQWLGVYGNWTTSFGANNGISATGAPFDPQTGEQFEAGIKTSLFEERLLATLAYYHITKDNLLTPDLTTPDPNDSVAIGQQRSQGIELDVAGRITDNLSLISSYAFTDARITKDNRTLNGQIKGYEGKRLNNVPEHAASLWLRYDLNGYEAPDGWSFGLGGVLASQVEGDVENTFQLPGYVRMDAFASYKLKVGPTRITTQFNIRNLLDKKYYESSSDLNVAPRMQVYPGAPLTAIGSIRIEF